MDAQAMSNPTMWLVRNTAQISSHATLVEKMFAPGCVCTARVESGLPIKANAPNIMNRMIRMMNIFCKIVITLPLDYQKSEPLRFWVPEGRNSLCLPRQPVRHAAKWPVRP